MHTYIIENADFNLIIVVTCEHPIDVEEVLDQLIYKEISSYAKEGVS